MNLLVRAWLAAFLLWQGHLKGLDAPDELPVELAAQPLCPKEGVWNFQALKTPAFIETGEFQTPFFGHSAAMILSKA